MSGTVFLLLAAQPGMAAASRPDAAAGAEPGYCDYNAFIQHEIPYQRNGLVRQRVFQFGKLHLIGLGVGESDTSAVEAMAADFSQVGSAENYCTWYHNKGNSEAQAAFNWFPVDKPGSNIQKSVQQYHDVLHGVFADNAINMLDCAAKHDYIALGCDGQRHRGPTVFGMLLAFSGCTAAHSAAIVNQLWGLNGVPEASRLAVIEEGARLGAAEPEARLALQKLLSR